MKDEYKDMCFVLDHYFITRISDLDEFVDSIRNGYDHQFYALYLVHCCICYDLFVYEEQRDRIQITDLGISLIKSYKPYSRIAAPGCSQIYRA